MSVASTYAEALYEAAIDANALEAVASGVGALASAYRDSTELRQVLTSPEIATAAKKSTLVALAEGSHPLVANALQVLVDRGRISELPEIAAALQERVTAAEGRLEVSATTAIPLPDDLRATIINSIQERTGKTVNLAETVDPEIIGGLVLQVGETVIDGSVRNDLEKLRRDLGRASVDAAAVAGA